MVLICYDGSADAKAAIEATAALLNGQEVSVLTVWEPFVEVAARTAIGFGMVPSIPDPLEIDRASATVAQDRAEEGAKLAREAGMEARSRTCAQRTTTAAAILDEAAAIDASAIVMGSRGLTGLKSLLLGSVSHAVIQRADRAVVVVPSPEVAASRAREDRERQGGA
jgi:nucleotide-binding universal stress UspA family protein